MWYARSAIIASVTSGALRRVDVVRFAVVFGFAVAVFAFGFAAFGFAAGFSLGSRLDATRGG